MGLFSIRMFGLQAFADGRKITIYDFICVCVIRGVPMLTVLRRFFSIVYSRGLCMAEG